MRVREWWVWRCVSLLHMEKRMGMYISRDPQMQVPKGTWQMKCGKMRLRDHEWHQAYRNIPSRCLKKDAKHGTGGLNGASPTSSIQHPTIKKHSILQGSAERRNAIAFRKRLAQLKRGTILKMYYFSFPPSTDLKETWWGVKHFLECQFSRTLFHLRNWFFFMDM